MSDTTAHDDEGGDIDTSAMLEAANKQLVVDMSKTSMPLDIQIRTIALTIGAKFVSDTCVKEGALYNALKMDNKLGDVVSLDHAMRAALVFERYLWGEWSKGIVTNSMAATAEEYSTAMADSIEEELRKRGLSPDSEEPPIRPSAGTE